MLPMLPSVNSHQECVFNALRMRIVPTLTRPNVLIISVKNAKLMKIVSTSTLKYLSINAFKASAKVMKLLNKRLLELWALQLLL